MDATGPHDAAQTNGGNSDLAAVKRLLSDFRDRLEALDYDVRNLYVALDGPPGTVVRLANEVCDRDWFVDDIDIRDLLPARCLSTWPASAIMNAAASSTASSSITASDSITQPI